jgi:glycerol-3-phosphate acyltransferase PlsX
MMKIGVDILGGDFAPEATVLGSILAQKVLPADTKLVLIGDEEKIKIIATKEKFDTSVWDIIHTPDYIDMGEHPSKAFSQKPEATIPVGFKLLKSGAIDGFASAGSTGAMMVGAMMVIKSVEGIIRPSIAAMMPTNSNNYSILLDVGINPDVKPDVLLQYGILGSLYAKYVLEIENPRVALLNIGSEEEKGNLLTKAAFTLFKESTKFNFVGNFEGHDLFSDEKADVIVCDGFVGNVVLKEAEAFYHLIKKRKVNDPFFDKFNFENHGGTPILGINSVAVIGHGISNDIAIKSMILNTCHVVKVGLIDKIKEAFK